MKILADATLPDLENLFNQKFQLDFYHNYHDLQRLIYKNDILLCRSTLKVDEDLLNTTPIKYVATASSGSCHINKKYLNENNIQLLDAKGANAKAVCDYVLATIAYLSTNNILKGNKTGIIGLGTVGSIVAQQLSAFNYEVVAFDPFKKKSDNQICAKYLTDNFSDLFSCDLISIHANLHQDTYFPSYNLLNKDFFKNIKPDTIILNAARGGIVDEKALLASKKNIYYCADVYQNEPHINPQIINFATLCTPHIAGHSIEGKDGCIKLICQKIHALKKIPYPFNKIEKNVDIIAFSSLADWQDYVLELYNPIKETKILKKAHDLSGTFVQLRKAHDYRHDFSGK